MNANDLKERLNAGRLNKEQIDVLVSALKEHPELTKPLLEEVFAQDAQKTSFNASWVFDHLMRKRLDLLLPHLDFFLKGTAVLQTESCRRPLAHVIELLCEAHFKSKLPQYTKTITVERQEKMVHICFDWLIGGHKVATKVFAMTSLFYLGESHQWIRPELRSIIEQLMPMGTAAFKNRGGKILAQLKNLGY